MYGEQARVLGGKTTVDYFKTGTWYFYGKATTENITQDGQYAILSSVKLRLNSMPLETTTIKTLYVSIMNNANTSTVRTSTSFNTTLKF
jgi:hypothetical protein